MALFILAVVSAVLLIFSLLERVELIRQNDVNLELRAELRELREENRRLAIKYEYAVNMTELEKYAKNELGMLSIAQIVPEKIEVETQDKALSPCRLILPPYSNCEPSLAIMSLHLLRNAQLCASRARVFVQLILARYYRFSVYAF